MTDIKKYLPYCVFQEATIKSVHENEFTNGEYRVNSLTYNLIHKYAYDDDNEDYTIIPHMRKLSSLTEDEAMKMGWTKLEDFGAMDLADVHYLTTIGIAWWATEEMWESGALIEVKRDQA